MAMLCLWVKYEYQRRFVSLSTLIGRFNASIVADSNNAIQPLTIDEVVKALQASDSEEVSNVADSQVAPASAGIAIDWEGGHFPVEMKQLEPLINGHVHRRGEGRFVIRMFLPSGKKTKRGSALFSPVDIRTIAYPDEATSDQ